MSNNSMSKLETIQSKFPKFYKKYFEDNSIIYNLIKSISENDEDQNKIIDRMYAMIGIDTTYDEDLEYRWGKLLGLSKLPYETYDEYRAKLKLVIPMFSGGTAEAVKYALACYMNINSDKSLMDEYIFISDAWVQLSDYYENVIANSNREYDRTYGNFFCIIKTPDNSNFDTNKAQEIVDNIKSAGTNAYIIFLLAIMSDIAQFFMNDTYYIDNIKIAIESDTANIMISDENTNIFIENMTDYVSSMPIYDENAIINDSFIVTNKNFVTNGLYSYDIVN